MPDVVKDADDRIDPVTFFSQEIHQAVTGMIYLGAYSKQIEFVGHRFTMETIRPHMKFAMAIAMEPYRNTLQEPQAWGGMHVAMALTSVDGKKDFCPPVGDNEVEFVKARLNWLTNKTGWWQPTIDYLFGEYLAMEAVVVQAITELHSLAKAGKAIYLPSPGFSTAPASSTVETVSEDPPWEGSNLNS
jgi:hypothetical protein